MGREKERKNRVKAKTDLGKRKTEKENAVGKEKGDEKKMWNNEKYL